MDSCFKNVVTIGGQTHNLFVTRKDLTYGNSSCRVSSYGDTKSNKVSWIKMNFSRDTLISLDMEWRRALNVKYLLLLSFLTAAEFYNLGHIQGCINSKEMIFSGSYYSHLSNKHDVTLTDFGKFHPAQNKNAPCSWFHYKTFNILTEANKDFSHSYFEL